jgi:hypothetical protein
MSSSELVQNLYRAHLPSFSRFAFHELNSSRPLKDNWHIDVVGDALATCLRGGTRRLILNVPPRSLKSLCASTALPVFALGRDPRRKVMVIVGTRELAADLQGRALDLMRSSRCRSLFPHLRPSERRGEVVLPYGGGIAFAHVGQGLVGRGADITIIDDPISPALARDEGVRRGVHAWFDAEVLPRLNDKSTGVVIVVMQRVHPDDLTAHLLRKGGWAQLCLPALAARDETWHLSHGRVVTRRKGMPLNPDQESKAALRELLFELGPFNFSAQYLQAPLTSTSEYRTGYFQTSRPPNWTPEMGLPGAFFGRVSEVAIILHEVFAEGDPPPQLGREAQISDAEWEQACVLQQQRLIAQVNSGA